jgi:hypothetical protein
MEQQEEYTMLVNQAFEQCNTLGIDFQALSEAVNKINAALSEWANKVAEAFKSFMPTINYVLSELASETDCKAYAKWYNARHPGHRINWRRLSRPQRSDAYVMFHS